MTFKFLFMFALFLCLFFFQIGIFSLIVFICLTAYLFPIILYYLFSIQAVYLIIHLLYFLTRLIGSLITILLVILELTRSFFGWQTLQEDWEQLRHQMTRLFDYLFGWMSSKKHNSYDTGICPICMEADTQRESLYCGHFFCPSCIASWQEKSTKCPVCRFRIESP